MTEVKFTVGFKHLVPDWDPSPLSMKDAALCLLYGTPYFEEFRAKYGHLSLVFQELEMELKTTVDYMKRWCEMNQIMESFEDEPKEASFEALIRMFASQLARSEGSRDIIGKLHQARKYRNHLAHDFLSPKDLVYHVSAGGRQKTIQRLEARINMVIPLVMIVHRIGREFGSCIGMTAEVLTQESNRYFEMLGLLDDKQRIEYTFGRMPEDTTESASERDPEEY
jgi:hypothetical protein